MTVLDKIKSNQPSGSQLLSTLNQVWLVVLILVVWWFVSSANSSAMVPSLQSILTTLVDELTAGRMLSDLAYSLTNLAIAFGLSCLLGVGVGLLVGLNKTAGAVFDPLLQYVRSIPKVALVPLIVVLLGIDRESKITIIFLACLWPILMNTADGIRGIDRALFDVRRAYRLPQRLTLLKVVLPAIGPQIFAGMRIALSFGVVLLVFSEMYGATQGIGFSILQSGRSFEIPATWAGTLALGVVGYLLNLAFGVVERRALSWHFQSTLQS